MYKGSIVCMVMQILKALGNIKDNLQSSSPIGKSWESWGILAMKVLSKVSSVYELIHKINLAATVAPTYEFH